MANAMSIQIWSLLYRNILVSISRTFPECFRSVAASARWSKNWFTFGISIIPIKHEDFHF